MKCLLAGVIVLASVGLAAQEPSTPALALARAPGSWVVEIVTTGGFTGRGLGSLAAASDGATRCTAPLACSAPLSPDAIGALGQRLATLRTAAWDSTASDSGCRDCYHTRMTVRRRQADGSEVTSEFTWTDISRKKLPADVREIYETARRVVR